MNVLVLLVFGAQIPIMPPPAAPEKAPEIVARGACASPRNAALTWLGNLNETHDEVRAALCTEAIMAPIERQKRMVSLKKIFDARGILVNIDDLPRTASHSDEVSGRQTIAVSKLMPEVILEKQGEQWVFPRKVLEDIPALYRSTFPFDLGAVVKFLPAWMTAPFLGVSLWQLFLLALLVGIGLIIRRVVAKVVSVYVRGTMRRFNIKWGSELVGDWALPLGALAMAGIWAIALPLLSLPVRFAQLLLFGVRTVAAVSVVLLAYRAVDFLSAFMKHRAEVTDTKLDDQLVPLARRGLKILVLFLGILFVLQNLAIDVTGLVATLGVGTIAVALAAKDTVQNLFGSVTIFLDKPFHIGDWVDTCGVEGVIEEVGFRSTRMRTFEDSVVTIPNAKFTDALVNNYGLRNLRRCMLTLELTYDTSPDEIEAFCEGVRVVLNAHPATEKSRITVAFKEYGASGLGVLVYFFLAVKDWSEELRARHEIFLDFKRLADSLGVGFAFPTQTLHVESMSAASNEAPARALSQAELAEVVNSFTEEGKRRVPPGPRLKGIQCGAE